MTNETTLVTLDSGGYKISQGEIDKVVNPFLDLNEALDKYFYFLEGQYDQIVLEKIFKILNALTDEVQIQRDVKEASVDEAEIAYGIAKTAFNALQQVGAYGDKGIADLVTILSAYTVPSGIFPSITGESCKTTIDLAHINIISMVYDLCLEEMNKISWTNPTFSGDANLVTLRNQLDVDASLVSLGNALGSLGDPFGVNTSLASLGKALGGLEDSFNVDASLDELQTALEARVKSLKDEAGENFNEEDEAIKKINDAITAINDYHDGIFESYWLPNVKTKLNAIKDLPGISAITPSVTGIISAIDNKSSYDAAVTAINTYNGNKSPANLQAVKTKLSAAKDLPGISAITPSVTGIISAIDNKISYNEAVTAINEYNNAAASVKPSLLPNVKTKLNAIKNLTGISAITPSVTDVIFAIDNKSSYDAAVTAINTYNTTKNDTNLQNVRTKLSAISSLSSVPSQIASQVSSMLENINTYFNVKTAIDTAMAAISAFGNAKNEDNLRTVMTALSGVNAALASIPSALKASYYNANLKNAIDTAINNIDLIDSKLSNLTTIVRSYDSLNSLTASSAAFQNVKDALSAFLSDDIRPHIDNSTVPNLVDRMEDCSTMVFGLYKFDDFYEKLDSLLAILQNQKIKDLLSDSDKSTYYNNDTSLKEPLTYANLNNLCDAVVVQLNRVLSSFDSNMETLYLAEQGLKNFLGELDGGTGVNDLLNLCMMASTPKPQNDGTYRLVTGIQQTVDINGNYTYALQYGGATLSKADYDASFSKADGYKHYSLPYLALAIMYEKVGIQQMILVEQLKQVEKINDAIRENNTALRALSTIYDKAYTACTQQSSATWIEVVVKADFDAIGMTMEELNNYLAHKVNSPWAGGTFDANAGSNHFSLAVSQFNRDGDSPGATTTQNIDVKEQSTLTVISNKQDAVRIYGDQLSTDSQLMTTKMSQYMQNSNACVSAATQVVKSVGDYLKTIVSNVR